MKKNKNRFTAHIFFYLNSIFVFTIVAISAFLKVTTLLYDQDMAEAIKNGEGMYTLPLTGSFDDSFNLVSLIIVLAILAAFYFIIKLSKFDPKALFNKPKSKKK